MPQQYQDKRLLSKIILVLRELRNERAITLETVYFDTGIHVARIEQGNTNITISTVAKICDYYRISLADFFVKVEKL